jgi:hypothetical protein
MKEVFPCLGRFLNKFFKQFDIRKSHFKESQKIQLTKLAIESSVPHCRMSTPAKFYSNVLEALRVLENHLAPGEMSCSITDHQYYQVFVYWFNYALNLIDITFACSYQASNMFLCVLYLERHQDTVYF